MTDFGGSAQSTIASTETAKDHTKLNYYRLWQQHQVSHIHLILRPPPWPKPEESSGRFVDKVRNVSFWDMTGPALALSVALFEEIEACLAVQLTMKTVMYVPFMCGMRQDRAEPVVVVCGGDKQSRDKAKQLIEQHCLTQVPGCQAFRVVVRQYAPGCKELKEFAGSADGTTSWQPSLPGNSNVGSEWQSSFDDVIRRIQQGLGHSPSSTGSASGAFEGSASDPFAGMSSLHNIAVLEGRSEESATRTSGDTRALSTRVLTGRQAGLCSSNLSVIPEVEIQGLGNDASYRLVRMMDDGKPVGTASGPINIENIGTLLLTSAHFLGSQPLFDEKPDYDSTDDDDALQSMFGTDSVDRLDLRGAQDHSILQELDVGLQHNPQHLNMSANPGTEVSNRSAHTSQINDSVEDSRTQPVEHLSRHRLRCYVGSPELDYVVFEKPPILRETALMLHSYRPFRPVGRFCLTDGKPSTALDNLTVMTPRGIMRGRLSASATLAVRSHEDHQHRAIFWTFILHDSPDLPNNKLLPGDSGSLVFDPDKALIYGHIIAGDTTTGFAFVVPYYLVHDEIVEGWNAKDGIDRGILSLQSRSSEY